MGIIISFCCKQADESITPCSEQSEPSTQPYIISSPLYSSSSSSEENEIYSKYEQITNSMIII